MKIETKNSKTFYNTLIKYIDYYKYVKVYYEKGNYNAELTHKPLYGGVFIPRGNKHYKIGVILFSIGATANMKFKSWTQAFCALLKRRKYGTRLKNVGDIQSSLF